MAGTLKIYKDKIIVNLKGELDHHMATILKTQLKEAMDKHNIKKLLFNFKDVTFMDSSGIGMILGRYKELQPIGGKIGVINMNNRVKKIFDMSGLLSVITYIENEQEFIETF